MNDVLSVLWILDDDNNIVKPKSIDEWLDFFKSDRRVLRRDNIEKYLISSVFLTIDHNYSDSDDPILFETMIFKGYECFYCIRAKTFSECLKNHEQEIEELKGGFYELI